MKSPKSYIPKTQVMSALYSPHPLKHVVGLFSSTLFYHSSDLKKIIMVCAKFFFLSSKSFNLFPLHPSFLPRPHLYIFVTLRSEPYLFLLFCLLVLVFIVVVCYCNPLCHLHGILSIVVAPYFLVLTSNTW